MKALGWCIAVSALLITIPRYLAVFETIDDSSLTALGMGILLAGGAAYIFHAWARTKRKDAWTLLVAFGLNLLYEPFIISPFVLARLHGLTLAQSMSAGYSVFWSIIVAAAPVVLVGGVVLAISFQRDKRTPRTDTKQRTEQTESATESATPVSVSEEFEYVCMVPGCGFSTSNAKQWAGHHNAHRTKGEQG